MHKRRRSSEMAALTIPMLVSPVTMTKVGCPHVFDLYLHHGVEVQNVKGIEASIRNFQRNRRIAPFDRI